MKLTSDITFKLGADFEDITKGIKRFSKTSEDIFSNTLKLGLDKSIVNFNKELARLKNPVGVSIGQFKKVNEMAKRIRDATRVKLEIDVSNATKKIDGLRYQILGTYASFKGLISKPVSASIDFNNSINEINRFAKLSKNELDNLKKDIWSLGKNNGVSMPDILKTTELSAQLGTPKEELKDFSQLALNLQVGLKLGVEESVSSITKISKAFSLNTKELSIFGDEITSMAESTKTSAKAILEVTKTTLAGAKAFGLSAKEASALSASFLSVGLDSSEASSSINKFFTELNNIDNATPAFHQALAKMGIDAEQLKEDIQSNPQKAIQNLFEDLNDLDDEERFGVISELFGKKMANNINSAKDGIKAFNLALEASKDSSNALQKSVDRVAGDGFGDLVVSLGSAFKHLAVSIGDGFIPILSKLFGWLKSATEGIASFLDSNKWLASTTAITFGVFVAVKSIGLLIASFKTFSTLVFYPFQYLWKSLMISDTRFKFSTIVTNIYKRSLLGLKGGFRSIQDGLGGALFSLVTFDMKLIKHNALMKISSIRAFSFKNALYSLVPSLKQAGGGVLLFGNVIKGVLAGLRVAAITSGVGLVIIGIGVAFAGVAWAIMRFWKPIKAFFGGFFKGLYEGLAPLREAFSNLWTSIKTAFAPLAPLFSKIFGEVNNTEEELSSFAQAGLVVGKVIGGVISLIAKPFEYLIKAITLAFEWGGKLTSWLGDILGLGDDKKLEVNATKSIKGSLDETLARQNENKAKMLSQIQSSQTDNSRQIHDYKQITINTTGNAQEIARAINTYSYDDDDNL